MDHGLRGLAAPTGTRLTALQIATQQRCTKRNVHLKLGPIVESLNGNHAQYVESVPGRGGVSYRYDLALVNAAFDRGEPAGRGEPAARPYEVQSSEPETCTASGAVMTRAIPSLAPNPGLQLSVAGGQALLPFARETDEDRRLIPSDVERAWCRARRKAIELVISEDWRRWIGQVVHGVDITGNSDSFVQALAVDSSKCGVRSSEPIPSIGPAGTGATPNFDLRTSNSLLDWPAIDRDLRLEANDPAATLGTLSPRTLWRWISAYKKGRALALCDLCGGEVDPKSRNCQKCRSRQELPKGLAALQRIERRDRGEIRLHPVHAEYLTAAYFGGDDTVRKARLALERPRSAVECLNMLLAEIAAGELPGPPAAPEPSLRVIRRWIREALPAILRSYARDGRKRALTAHGPYIRRAPDEFRVNDRRSWDFRRSNVRVWFQADGQLYRLFCCAAIDDASRDVVMRFDLYPSAALFKSTLRHAVTTWGVPHEDWMDNGKEFTCEEILGRPKKERFEVDDECRSAFHTLGSEPHYSIRENPNGKAKLERFFQTMDRLDRLPG